MLVAAAVLAEPVDQEDRAAPRDAAGHGPAAHERRGAVRLWIPQLHPDVDRMLGVSNDSW